MPLWPKLVFWAGVLYALSPWDFLPDFLIPILGWTDDVIIFIAAARYFLRACPREVVMEHAVAMGGRLS
ncbi:MAG: DUF1232 domain-containing protein [candidate division KSB1 bacterium]|nr:DUF1232 domain-containing protein [candidate division KSB1 bacterium]